MSCSQLTDGKTEARRGSERCPGSHSLSKADLVWILIHLLKSSFHCKLHRKPLPLGLSEVVCGVLEDSRGCTHLRTCSSAEVHLPLSPDWRYSQSFSIRFRLDHKLAPVSSSGHDTFHTISQVPPPHTHTAASAQDSPFLTPMPSAPLGILISLPVPSLLPALSAVFPVLKSWDRIKGCRQALNRVSGSNVVTLSLFFLSCLGVYLALGGSSAESHGSTLPPD